jgi:aspartate/glutamate racemase
MFDANYHFNIEVTKRVGAQQDGEFNSIRDHLNTFKNNNTQKNVYCIFISPNTSQRMIDSIKDHNRQRVIEGNPDLKILPLSFETLELVFRALSKE